MYVAWSSSELARKIAVDLDRLPPFPGHQIGVLFAPLLAFGFQPELQRVLHVSRYVVCKIAKILRIADGKKTGQIHKLRGPNVFALIHS
jgi:hypothetical protein